MKKYNVKINGRNYEVAVERMSGEIADVIVNGSRYNVELSGQDIRSASSPTCSSIPSSSNPVPVAATDVPGRGSDSVNDIKSPLPGVVLSLDVKEGDQVKRGQRVAVIEAMKMENEIRSGTDGIVRKVYVGKGDSLLDGAKIMRVE